tara:strand:+ start:604 stop:792 length:189 start_codon:yes stop_codon:yes gene_type:complete
MSTKEILGINQYFNKRDTEMVSEIITEAIREHPNFKNGPEVVGFGYQIDVTITGIEERKEKV